MTEKVNLRLTHPTLYRSAIVLAIISIGLGLNFIFTRPTFNPYGIDKMIIGSIFLTLGSAKLVGILVVQNLKFIRLSMALCTAYMVFWGIGTSLTYFLGQTSLQLFVLYSGLTVLEIFLLMEPYINPLTRHNGNGGIKL